jgi:hypothetical protein
MRIAIRTFGVLVIVASACRNPIAGPGPLLITVTNPPPTSAPPGTAFPQAVLRFADAEGTPLVGARVEALGDGIAVLSSEVTDGNGRIGVQWTLPRWEDPTSPYPLNPPFGLPGRYSLRIATVDDDASVTFETSADVFRAEQIDASGDYGCGITAGEVWCWGFPSERLAGGYRHASAFRLNLPSGVRAAEVRIGPLTICIRDLSTSRPWCMGVEDGPLEFRQAPSAPALSEIVDAGLRFCGRGVADSLAWCWSVENGQVGVAAPVDTFRFGALVGQATGWRGNPVGYACGLAIDGRAWCWGENHGGQLGTGSQVPSAHPVRAVVDDSLVALRAGMGGVCAETKDGNTWCWGSLLLGSGERAPRRIEAFGQGPFIPGEFDLYTLRPSGVSRWGVNNIPQPGFSGDGNLFTVVDLVEEAQACIRSTGGEVYCSWLVTHGGSDSRLGSGDLRPVHEP